LLYNEAAGELPFPRELVAFFPEDVRDDQGRLVRARGTRLEAQPRRLGIVHDYDVSAEFVLHHLMQYEAGHRREIGAACALIAQGGGPVESANAS
jgi:hypothetical protein